MEPPQFLTCPAVPELPVTTASRKPRRRIWRWLTVCFVVLFLLLLAPLVYGGVFAGLAARRLQALTASVPNRLVQEDFVGVRADVATAEEAVADIQSGISVTWFWRDMPWIGPRLQALERVAQVGSSVLFGADHLATAALSIQEALNMAGPTTVPTDLGIAPHRSFRSLSVEEKRTVLSHLSQSLSDIRIAREQIAIALDAWDRIPQDDLTTPVRIRLLPAIERLRQARTSLDQFLTLADVVLPLAGYPKEKQYLVLLQNADELRPTGGFIGTIGLVDVEAAELKQMNFQDVYAVDGPVQTVWKDTPPDILKRELGVKAWFLRDRNWSPDFPTTAEAVLDTYKRERTLATSSTQPSLDGVLAFQPGFFQSLLQLTGPITIDGKTFTAQNFFDELEFDVEQGFLQQGTPVRQRKEIVAKLGDALINTLMDQPASRWPALLNMVSSALERKDILLYDRDPATLSQLDARHWTGRTLPTSQDYLWTIDANLAALKTDGVMDKTIGYALDTSDMTDTLGPLATVTLTYHNTNRVIDWRRTRYRSYTRVYVPDGSALVSSDGAMLNDTHLTGGKVVPGIVDVMHELGKTVFGAFWAVEPGETRTLKFTYRLPAQVGQKIQDGTYRLLVQKQPGSRARLTLDLSFGKKLAGAVPAEDVKQYGDTRYRVDSSLDTDKTFDVTF